MFMRGVRVVNNNILFFIWINFYLIAQLIK